MIVHRILFGSVFSLGDYQEEPWRWSAPWRWSVLFSSDHGLLSWTPILCLAIIGLVMWRKTDRLVAGSLLASALAYYYLIASYPAWDGLSSFGARYFLPVTVIFVFGLTAFFSGCAAVWKAQRAFADLCSNSGRFVNLVEPVVHVSVGYSHDPGSRSHLIQGHGACAIYRRPSAVEEHPAEVPVPSKGHDEPNREYRHPADPRTATPGAPRSSIAGTGTIAMNQASL